jgi:hypothetical protein
MADEDVISTLPDGWRALGYEAFRSLIPTWPDWLRVDDREWWYVFETAYHTRHEGPHYAVATDLDPEGRLTRDCRLYGITEWVLTSEQSTLVTERASDPADLDRRVRRLRSELPDVLIDCDLTVLGRDGGINPREQRYEGARLLWKAYYRWDDNWDHDHCVFCGATLSLEEPDVLKAGYAVQGGSHGDDYHWVCGPCADERREPFGFEIEAGPDDR